MIAVHKKLRRSEDIKTFARNLRRQGKSYSEIVNELQVPRSTLHLWLKDISIPIRFTGEARKSWWKSMQRLAVEANKKKYTSIYSKIDEKILLEQKSLTIDVDFCKSLLSAIYWTEGSKGRHSIVVFANTDPGLTLLFVTLLRKCYKIDESKFRVRLHLHDYHNEEKVKTFWSHLLKIPQDQFTKTYRKERSKEKTFRRNFGGICFVNYNSVYLRAEIAQYGKFLGQKITGKINVPEVSSNWDSVSS